MYDEIGYFIIRALIILTVFVIFIGLPLGDTLIRKK